MPFYDYKCGQCGKIFEAMHGMGGQPSGLNCEFCGSQNVQRIFHPIGTLRPGNGHSSSGSSCSSCSSGTCGSCR